MATKTFQCVQSALIYTKPSTIRWMGLRLYSQYAPRFKDPIINKAELDKLLSEKTVEEINATSFKATPSNKTCSIFFDEDVRKFTNCFMRKGKKETARKVVEFTFRRIKHIQLRKYNAEKDEAKRSEIMIDPQEIFHLAIKNVTPLLFTKKIKKSGSWYRVPMAVPPSYAKFMGMRWLIETSKEKDPEERFYNALAEEILSASNNEGKAYLKKVELHKLCEANRSYAHYRWT